ncbi:MAG: bacteriocin [Bacteroidota bacterium]
MKKKSNINQLKGKSNSNQPLKELDYNAMKQITGGVYYKETGEKRFTPKK